MTLPYDLHAPGSRGRPRLPPDHERAKWVTVERNERCRTAFGCSVAELFAVLTVVVHYQQTGFSYARLEVEAAVERNEGITGAGDAASAAARRGVLKSIGKIYGWTHYLPTRRAFQMLELPVPEGLR